MTGRATVIRSDARALPLADDSVDLVISSPPYFALRSYQDGGEHYAGQIGSEATPAEFVDALIEVTRECVRVLKPSGSLWINLGDKYSQRPGQNIPRTQGGILAATKVEQAFESRPSQGNTWDAAPPKSLIGIPWRYALRCIDDLGLILRAEVIWAKPNGLPESVTDRVRRSHEQWFHFTREPRYYSAVDEIREPHDDKAGPVSRFGKITQSGVSRSDGVSRSQTFKPAVREYNPLGKLPGSVWTIPSEPLKVPDHLGIDHFAAFPLEWPRRIIQGWSPPGVCTACGEGRRPVTVAERVIGSGDKHRGPTGAGAHLAWGEAGAWGAGGGTTRTLTGYACACPEPTAPTRPAIVLDPFGGTGTTALAALALGRHGISVDMSQDYSRLARWRTTDERELAKAMRVDKPAVQVDGQGSLLDLLKEA